MTATAAPAAAFADLVQAAKGRVVCLAMSKDPNAKMTVLLFAPGGSAPERVAKVPTTDAAAVQVEAEAAVLHQLALLDLEMASASELLVTDRVTLRRLRHADEELPVAKGVAKRLRPKKAAARTLKQ